MSKQIRFGIGDAIGLRSTTWRVWTKWHDVYLSSRTLASKAKVSLHQSGRCQFSITSESFAGEQKPNQLRHMHKWYRRNAYPANGVTHMFRVIFPFTELREKSVEEKESEVVIWYPSPPLGYGAYVDLWLTPMLYAPPVKSDFMNELLGVLTMESGHFLCVTAQYMEIASESNVILSDLKNRARSDILLENPSIRGWALTLSDAGVYQIIEFAPFPDESK